MRGELRWWRVNVGRVLPGPGTVQRAREWAEWCGSLRECVGEELFGAVVERGRSDVDFRRGLVSEMRPFVWIVRNSRLCTVERVLDAVQKLHDFDELLAAIGVGDDARWRLANCLFDGCVCDGCDLWDGQRLAGSLPCKAGVQVQ